MFDWIVSVIDGWGYPGVFFLMLAENVFPPIPSELIMPLAGFLAGTGSMNFVLVVIAGTVGSVLGTLMWYYIGAAIGAARLKAFAARHGRWLTMSPSDIDNAIAWFNSRGRSAVFFGRMVPAVRTLISVPAGIARMPMGSYLALTTAGSAIWTTLLAGAGLVLQDNYHRVEGFLDPLSKVVLVLAVAIYVWRVIRWKPH